ncbi:ATP-dependent DNA helicase [Gardnerella sp. Marseille-Q2328]|uniref:ATP-dependent DNA helicase n=1 Tax=Gardnerella sp. Marseille-Q2328 TaxID=2759694 RepID=UPI00202560AC|nr:ATP-dependent DNA helicase [Gardnerella sp. Marseille-Q2328]
MSSTSDTLNKRTLRANTDSAEQSAAIQAPSNKDMLIVAGAGSGKTYTMTRRVIDLIDRGVAPESILGLTFTNKAAAELLARVAQAVSQHVHTRADSVVSSAHAGFLKPEVMTYDAFFQTIVRQYGLLVGFDQRTQPLSSAGARELMKPLVNDYVQQHPEVVTWYSFDALIDDVLALAADISCSMIGVNSKGESLDSVAAAVREIQQWNSAWIEHVRQALEQAETFESVPAKPSAIKLRRGKNESDEKYFEKCVNYGKEYVEYLNITLKNTCYESCKHVYEVAQKRAALLDLVLAFDDAKQRAHMAQFSDFTIAAYRLVTHFPSIAAQYRRQYSQVLLDEYQDTSTTQAMLIAALFHQQKSSGEGSGAGDAADATHITDATHIAAVGDPFQAIYSFRGASSGAFRKLQQTLNIGSDSQFSLTQTRRNARLILQAANAITKALRVPAVRHSSSLASEVEVNNLQYLQSAPTGTLSIVNMPTQYQEIEAVVRFAQYVTHTQLSSNDSTNDNTNATSPRVAVLFRSKTNIPLYEEALQRAGLRTLTVGYSALLEKPEVKDVLAALAVSADHTNTAALMRLMATPRFALSTDDLTALASVATAANVEYVFRALAQAGLVDASAPRSKWAGLVRAQQSQAAQTNSIHGGIFMADVLLEAYREYASEGRSEQPEQHAQPEQQAQSEQQGRLSQLRSSLTGCGFAAVLRAGAILDAIERAQSGSLHDVMRTAIEVLNIDIDVAVSRALLNENSSNTTLLNDIHATLDSMIALVDAYLQEMSDFTAPTLRGFMAWIASIDKIDDTPASVDEPADVVLLTIHQSKGLEWPAVAIVGLNEGSFPSNQGDGLRVERVEQSSNPTGQYKERAYATLEIAAKVPTPLRVDADILPRFPHDANLQISMDPHVSLAAIKTVEQIDAEIYGSRMAAMLELAEKFYNHEQAPDAAVPDKAREVYDAAMKTGALPLSQREERGRALHIDERHLMYVALTRAKYATLLTCSQSNAMTADGGDGGNVGNNNAKEGDTSTSASAASAASVGSTGARTRVSKPSVFWYEVYEAMQQSADGNNPSGNPSDNTSGNTESETNLGTVVTKVRDASNEVGYVVGANSQQLAEILSKPTLLPSDKAQQFLSWPASSSAAIRNVLRKSAQLVEEKREVPGKITGEVPSESTSEDTGENKESQSQSLFARAQVLIQDADLMPQVDWYHDVRALQNRAAQLSQSGNINVTTVQRRTVMTNDSANNAANNIQRLRNEWMAIIRPIPQPASSASDLGTRFHAWAEQFVKAGCLHSASFDSSSFDSSSLDLSGNNSESAPYELWPLIVKQSAEVAKSAEVAHASELTFAQKNLVEQLKETEKNIENNEKNNNISHSALLAERKLLIWKQRLATSTWAHRTPLAAEQPIVAHIPELGEQIINGKLDAIFAGGLNPHDSSKLYTVVDWKTGHKPTSPRDIALKLGQLDWYRLLLSLMTQAPLDAIDATLYYVNEAGESQREIHAEPKTKDEILAELHSDTLTFLDDDDA